MKIGLLPVVLAGAGMAQYAAASPLRVVVVTSHQEFPGTMGNEIRPEITATTTTVTNLNGAGRHHSCGSYLKNKAITLSNKFRETFGLPPIDFKHPPLPFLPPPIPLEFAQEGPHSAFPNTEGSYDPKLPPLTDSHGPIELKPMPQIEPAVPAADIVHLMPGRMGMAHHHHFRGSFLRRIHHSLMTLGPWEGRAVAFVLGCGIGVILRMVWVMAIIVARAIRGGRSTEDDDTSDAVLMFDAEDIMAPPPQYTDEKVDAIAQEDKATTKA